MAGAGLSDADTGSELIGYCVRATAFGIGRANPAETLKLPADDLPRHALRRGRDVGEQLLLLVAPQNAERGAESLKLAAMLRDRLPEGVTLLHDWLSCLVWHCP